MTWFKTDVVKPIDGTWVLTCWPKEEWMEDPNYDVMQYRTQDWRGKLKEPEWYTDERGGTTRQPKWWANIEEPK